MWSGSGSDTSILTLVENRENWKVNQKKRNFWNNSRVTQEIIHGVREERENKKLEIQERKLQHLLDKDKREFQQKEQLEIDKVNRPIYDEISKEAKSAKESIPELKRMKKLIDSGKLTNPLTHSILESVEHGIFGFGINLHAPIS